MFKVQVMKIYTMCNEKGGSFPKRLRTQDTDRETRDKNRDGRDWAE